MHRKCSPLPRKLPHPGEAQGGEQPDPRHVKVLSNVIVWGVEAVDVFTEIRVLFGVIVLGSILALVVVLRSIRARKQSRLEMKRHVQSIEVHRMA